jgi:hypothetical protein
VTDIEQELMPQSGVSMTAVTRVRCGTDRKVDFALLSAGEPLKDLASLLHVLAYGLQLLKAVFVVLSATSCLWPMDLFARPDTAHSSVYEQA